ncbi:class I SAM-dependent methyltransferase [Humibacter ginsenosidimutans]|uniref:Class I SAM-dependent methyltransferase n=1 Tax=Humibacter ginsenosidimutans TaxID=2599293 RepID=A0A5B8M2L9_9MICO|nr:class I SAM-dependent methyltransferase [Humibacter ginsenosidimutans]QDZ14179.1 class I SAM-dependent methyltransferase [Humibacter ginsenosidimutans]
MSVDRRCVAEVSEQWEKRCSGPERVWSGRPNPVLTDVAAALRAGRALDVGCGEGTDVLWLAERGWSAEGVDLSPTAVQRARDAARARGLPGARFFVGGLLTWSAGHTSSYDLVTAFFLHDIGDDRTLVLRRAAELVGPAGRLLVVSHVTMPPWAKHRHVPDTTERTSPETDRSALRLGRGWVTDLADIRSSKATGPNGEYATLQDGVLLMRRTA